MVLRDRDNATAAAFNRSRSAEEKPAVSGATTATNEVNSEPPEPSDSEYQAWSAPCNRPAPTLDLILPDGKRQLRNWNHFDEATYQPGTIELTFMGNAPNRVTIRGRNLRELWYLLKWQKCAWVKALPEEHDFPEPGDKAQVVTKIEVNLLKQPTQSD